MQMIHNILATLGGKGFFSKLVNDGKLFKFTAFKIYRTVETLFPIIGLFSFI